MYRLILLGGLEIEGSRGPPPDRAAQPRQLALLALLAASEAPPTRDTLVGRLWPEESDRRARRRLSDTLYVLRRALGSDAVLAAGDTLALNPEVIGSDLADFEAALDRGDLERAVSLYGGPFLDGFYLSGTAPFERWVEEQRRGLARRHLVALETLASAAEERGEPREAARWRRRIVAEEPYSSRAVRRLMRILVELGDRPAALKAARAHEQRVRSDLDARPDEELVELAEELRRREPREIGPAAAGTPRRAGGEPEHGGEGLSASRGPAPGGGGTGPAPPPDGRRRSRRGILRAGSLALGLLVLTAVVWLGVVTARSGRPGTRAGDAGRPSVVVLPWAVRGEAPDLEFLREGIADLLGLSLDAAPTLRSVDPYGVLAYVRRRCEDPADPECGSRVARRFGAGRFLDGTVVPREGGTFELWASLHDAGGERLRRTTVVGDREDPLAAIREAGRRLGLLPRAATARSDGAGAGYPADVASEASAPALRAYLEAKAHVRSARPARAIRALREAVAADSGFALAWYRLAVTAETLGGRAAWRLADSATARAVGLAETLPDRQRRTLRAMELLQRGEVSRAEEAFRDLLAAYPHDFDAWHLLGELRHHYNIVRGRRPDGEAAFRRVHELDPDFRPALWHLRLEALSKGRVGDFDSLTGRFLAVAAPGEEPRGDRRVEDRDVRDMGRRYARLARADHRLVGLLRAESDSARRRWFAELEDADGEALAWMAGLHFEHLSWPDRRRDAARMARILTRPDRPAGERARGFVILGSIALRAGRWRDAMAALDSLEVLDPTLAALWRADWASTSFLRVPERTLVEVRARAAEILADSALPLAPGLPLGAAGWTTIPPPDLRSWGLSRLALLSMRLGEHGEARAYAEQLGAASPLGQDLGRALRAEMHLERGDTRGARAALDSVRHGVRWDQLTVTLHPQLFLRAEILFALGELERARPWYALWTHLTGPRYLGPALRRLGQIHEAQGDRGKALSRYGEFVSLWRSADPELRPWVEEARERIAELRTSGE